MRTSFDLSDRRAVVLGGHGLIGEAIVCGLLDAGASVVVADSHAGDLPGGRDSAVSQAVVDASDIDGLSSVVAHLDDIAKGFDIWVSAHYPRTPDWGVPDEQVSAASWERNVTMQLTGSCIVASEACRRMARRGGGSVINLASIYGLVGPDFSVYEGTDLTTPAPYPAIKGGIIAHTRYLATLWGAQDVRVNSVAAGGVVRDQPASFVDAYQQRVPLGRLARPEEVSGPVVFLASAAASYVTGTTLVVDGGWTAR